MGEKPILSKSSQPKVNLQTHALSGSDFAIQATRSEAPVHKTPEQFLKQSMHKLQQEFWHEISRIHLGCVIHAV